MDVTRIARGTRLDLCEQDGWRVIERPVAFLGYTHAAAVVASLTRAVEFTVPWASEHFWLAIPRTGEAVTHIDDPVIAPGPLERE